MKKLILLTLAFLFGVSLFLWSGVYNIAANDEHWAITNKLIEILRERSIEVRAEEIATPDDLNDASRIVSGAANYKEMCSACHLAPGTEITELHQGLYPQPPVFHQSTAEHEEHGMQNKFWVIKNGIKLTGMPAWGASHSDDEIWSLVAFINQLGKLSATEYQKLITDNKLKNDRH
jgi:mono/diheme cytochrome c family protein